MTEDERRLHDRLWATVKLLIARSDRDRAIAAARRKEHERIFRGEPKNPPDND